MRYIRFTVVVLLIAAATLATAAFAVQRGIAPPHAAARPRPAVDTIHPRVRELWRVPVEGRVVGLPAADQAGVVVAVEGSHVMAISRDGDVEWTTAFERVSVHAPRIDGDLVFVAGERAVAALERETGTVVWSVPTTSTSDVTRANRPVTAGDTVIVTAADGLVLGLDRATGAERWREQLPTATTAEPAVGQTAEHEPVLVVVGIAEWWGIHPATGAPLWSGDIGLFGTSSPIVYASGLDLVAAVATDEHVIAVDAHTGAPRWDAPADQSELFQVPVLAANGSELLVPDHWGRVTSYRPSDGKRFWSSTGPDSSAQLGEPVWLAEQFVALQLDLDGPRLASPAGSFRMRPPGGAFGITELPLGGLVVTTAGEKQSNYVLLYDVSYH